MRALVLGGAACVWDDLRALGPWDGIVVATNDAGVAYPYRIDHWASLHPEKLEHWQELRQALHGNRDYTTWSRRCPELVDRTLTGWTSGSSGMFAVGVALELGAESVVCAGVPMDGSPHFFDEAGWQAFEHHRTAWQARKGVMYGRVFSMSGWTRELLGSPPWLSQQEAA